MLLGYFHQQKKTNRGFTLIEVMVSVSIFTIVTTIGLGALLSTVSASKQAQGERVALDSLAFVVDAMAREIRTGRNFVTGQDPSAYTVSGNGSQIGGAFSFINQDGCEVTYRLNTDGSNNRGFIERRRTDDNTNGTSPCTNGFFSLTNTTNLDITSLTFILRGANADTNDTLQPFVSFVINADTFVNGATSSITLQSGVTQRLLDIPPTTPPLP